jgi:transmembrane sensor
MNHPRQPVDESDDPPPKVTGKIAAEAAAWVARLHGPNRSREMELECLQWQSRSAAHRHAFERCTEVWMEVPNAAVAAGYVPTSRPVTDAVGGGGGGGLPVKRAAVAASCLLVVAAAASWMSWRDGTGYRTDVGEAQTVMLDDGTRMFLNTDTRVRVDLDSKQRKVEIQSGEAAFEVAKDAARPFVVRASASEVVALGTAFSVRLTPSGADAGELLTVTLLEGQVSLRPAGGVDPGAVAPAQAMVMQPGDRVRLARPAGGSAATSQQVDRPRLDQVIAWKRNEVVFDRTSLAEAVAEMNRYSRTPLVLVGELAHASWLVSGQFRTGDNAGFAKALAALHGLVVNERQGRLELSPGS